jgi:hypothetical protein
MKQSTSHVLMVRPAAFKMNEQTAINNYYQQAQARMSIEQALANAQMEFDLLHKTLVKAGITVTIIEDTPEPETPDAIFPNNWVSFHENNTLVLYSMFAENRRAERKLDVIGALHERGVNFSQNISFTHHENEGKYLEGTGSMVLDRTHRVAYASISERTHIQLVHSFCEAIQFTPVVFHSYQTVNQERKPIYHTNVMMCVGSKFAVLCSSCIDNAAERDMVIESLATAEKEIIYITEQQVNEFAGNMLELKNNAGDTFIVMSSRAYESLLPEQIAVLSKYGTLLHSPIPTIETQGGGSARCMIAEVFH